MIRRENFQYLIIPSDNKKCVANCHHQYRETEKHLTTGSYKTCLNVITSWSLGLGETGGPGA